MPWDYPDPFTLPLVPQADDIDALNHTNNGAYVRWCEKIGWAHSEKLGLGVADYVRLDRAMAIRRGEYDYLLPTQRDHQAVKTLGRELVVEARSTEDDIVEAIRWQGPGYVVGVQWHPEFMDPSHSHLLDGGPVLAEFLAVARAVKTGKPAVAAKNAA